METKVFYQVNKVFTLINAESKIATFEKEEDAINYARLSKISGPKYGFKVVKVTDENIFSTEVEEKGE